MLNNKKWNTTTAKNDWRVLNTISPWNVIENWEFFSFVIRSYVPLCYKCIYGSLIYMIQQWYVLIIFFINRCSICETEHIMRNSAWLKICRVAHAACDFSKAFGDRKWVLKIPSAWECYYGKGTGTYIIDKSNKNWVICGAVLLEIRYLTAFIPNLSQISPHVFTSETIRRTCTGCSVKIPHGRIVRCTHGDMRSEIKKSRKMTRVYFDTWYTHYAELQKVKSKLTTQELGIISKSDAILWRKKGNY